MESKKIVLSGTDEVPVATITTATFGDIFTTTISTTECVTGLYGLTQKALLFVGGMMLQSKRMGGPLNVFGGS